MTPYKTDADTISTSRHASLVDHAETELALHAAQGGQHRVLQVFLVSGSNEKIIELTSRTTFAAFSPV